jgi:hypothetical protein
MIGPSPGRNSVCKTYESATRSLWPVSRKLSLASRCPLQSQGHENLRKISDEELAIEE